MSIFSKQQNAANKDNTNSGATHVDGQHEDVQPWEQPQVLSATHNAFSYLSESGTTLEKVPHQAYDVPSEFITPHEDIFHPVKMMKDTIDATNRVAGLVDSLIKQLVRERSFLDKWVPIGLTIEFEVDYADFKYMYALSSSALTLLSSSGGISVSVAANQWTSINLQRGTKLTVQGGSDQPPQYVLVRRCDVAMPNFVTSTNITSSSANLSSVASTVSSVVLLNANGIRKGASIYNDSTSILYIALAPTTSLTAYTTQIPAAGFYELPPPDMYTGVISGLWNIANGNARITEMI